MEVEYDSMEKNLIINEIKDHKNNPKTVFEWISFFGLSSEEKKDFIQTIDTLVENYEVILKDNRLYLGEWEGYFHGKIRTNRRGFGFIDFEEKPSIYVSKDNLKNVYDQDTIVVQLLPDSDEGKVIKVLERNLKRIVGVVLSRRKPAKFIADNLMYENQIRISNLDDFKNIHRHKVLLEVQSFESGYILCEIKEVLGHADDPGVDILSVLIENEIRVEWPKDVKDAIDSIPLKVSKKDMQNRLDLRDDLIFTIDGADAKDLDDAVSITKKGDNYVLSVHIIDVDHYVRKDSVFDIEASKRGTSVYVIDRVVSMLPPQLSNGICSLNPNEDRLAISTIMEINKNGNVVSYDIKPTVINNKQRLTYEMVNMVLKDKNSVPEYSNVYDSLIMMEALSEILQQRRNKLGAIDFDKDEADLQVDKDGFVVDIKLKERGVSEKIIENFMVTTNEVISRLMAWSEWPALYRVHEKPDAAKMRDFAGFAQILGYKLKGNMDEIHPHQLQKLLSESKGSENHFVLTLQLLRSMQKARYDHNNIGHFGLGSLEYSHFTSPIRRYPDLLLHRMVKKYFFNNNFSGIDQDLELMAKMGKQTSEAERKAIFAEREVNDMKTAEYMEGKINEVYAGVISSVHKFGMFVQLPNLVEGLVRVDSMDGYYTLNPSGFALEDKANKVSYKIGQKVKVVVVGASKQARNVDFEIVKEKKRGRKK